MKIEIWSDVICPFCYIGKRNLEKALEQFPDRDQLEIIWRSFMLDPSIPYIAENSYAEHLVIRKGLSIEQVNGMISGITQTAKHAGLEFNFEKSVLTNSYKAHQFIQFAKSKGLGDQAEEVLFEAFFTSGKDTADTETLLQLAETIGLEKKQLATVLENNTYSSQIDQEMKDAKKQGLNGVPFFLFNQKHAVSGAQPPEAFLSLLNRSFSEWQVESQNNILDMTGGGACSLDGECE